jgi:siroheme synthase
MPGGHEAQLAQELMAGGLDSATPCLVVSRATRSDEQVVETTVGELPQLITPPAPTILLIGVLPGPKPADASEKLIKSKTKFI